MRSWRRRWFSAFVLAAVLATMAQAQQATPRVGYVYPAGAQQGTEVELTVGGQFLDGVDKEGAAHAFFTGSGLQATVVEHAKPMSTKEYNTLRDRLTELKKKPRDVETQKEIAAILQKLSTYIKKVPNPAIAERVTLKLSVAADAPPGVRELRLGTRGGLTNPLVFCVGQLPEVSKKPAKLLPEPGAGKGARYRTDAKDDKHEPPKGITLPAVVNGQIMPGSVDRYRFSARKGQRLVVAVAARDLIPYLPDAVPGWFQAAVALYDARGDEVAFADHYEFRPDPIVQCVIPADGDYVMEIRDSIYRGREDFVYRIVVGELPYVTSVFPLGGPLDGQTVVDVCGWNLPAAAPVQDTRGKSAGIYPLALPQANAVVQHTLFAVDTLPEIVEHEPNDQPGNAQPVSLPVIVNGRIDRPGDWDVFRFAGQAGQEIVAEVYARRLDSPLDSIVKLTDAAGQQLAMNDDHTDKGSGLNTHHADSYLRATLPAAGAYYVHIGDTQHKGGPDYAYRLRISQPRPDYELRVVPPSVSVLGGGSAPLTVYALRKDGYSGEIAIDLNGAPSGYSLSGGRVPAGQDKITLTLCVPSVSTPQPVSLRMEGRATIGGQEVVHPAVPAEDMMQAFEYRHLVPTQEMQVNVTGRVQQFKGSIRIVSPLPVKIPAGGTARVRINVSAKLIKGRIHLDLADPPEGMTLAELSAGDDGSDIVLKTDGAKLKPGQQGNLIVQAFAATEKAGKGKAVKARTPIATLPAVPYEIVSQ